MGRMKPNPIGKTAMAGRTLAILLLAAAPDLKAHSLHADVPAPGPEREALRARLLEEWHEDKRPQTALRRDEGRPVMAFAAMAAATARDAPPQAACFQAFAPKVSLRWDPDYLYVESNGMPDHPLMVGITKWIGRFPMPQGYKGENAWRIPLMPVPAKTPLSAKTGFYRGAIGMAADGVPIFNPLTNEGRDTFLSHELDRFGGHAGNGEDYHYHIAPLFLQTKLGPSLPIGYALDGYPLYGLQEPDGSPAGKLDEFNGHTDASGSYHYHASKTYPYVNGGFHGEVTERGGQVDPQPEATLARRSPLKGDADVRITDFTVVETDKSYVMKYQARGQTKTVRYAMSGPGEWTFQFVSADGKATEEPIREGERRGGGSGSGGGGGGSAGGAPPPPPPPPPGEERNEKGRPMAKAGDPQEGQLRRPWMQMHGAEIDGNHDNFITAEEMVADMSKAFAVYDRNQDGAIATAEKDATGDVRQGSAFAGLIFRHFDELDKDGDGSVSRAEMLAVVKYIFETADQNHDGKVSKEEWETSPNAPLGRRGPGGPPPKNGADGRESTTTKPPMKSESVGAGQRQNQAMNKGGDGKGPKKPGLSDTEKVNVYADNWFMLYINGKLTAVDPIDFLPHNVVTIDILPEYPMTIAIMAKDNADAKTGMEYGDHIGDGGFIIKFADGTVSDANWKAKAFFKGPLNHDTRNPKVEYLPIPEKWWAVDFDDSQWARAVEYTEERVKPKEPFYQADFTGAKFIWTDDLDLDNTVIFRTRIDKPGWKPNWTTKPDLDIRGAPFK